MMGNLVLEEVVRVKYGRPVQFGEKSESITH